MLCDPPITLFLIWSSEAYTLRNTSLSHNYDLDPHNRTASLPNALLSPPVNMTLCYVASVTFMTRVFLRGPYFCGCYFFPSIFFRFPFQFSIFSSWCFIHSVRSRPSFLLSSLSLSLYFDNFWMSPTEWIEVHIGCESTEVRETKSKLSKAFRVLGWT